MSSCDEFKERVMREHMHDRSVKYYVGRVSGRKRVDFGMSAQTVCFELRSKRCSVASRFPPRPLSSIPE
jgi:hypothetical protein